MTHNLRTATPEDAAGIARVTADAPWYPDDAGHTPSAITSGIRSLLTKIEDRSTTVLVAVDEDAGEVVGYATVHWHPYVMLGGWEGLIAELFVAASCRGQGIGTALLENVRARASARGCVRLMLLNGRRSEAYARRFYRQRGWRERDEIANFVYPLECPTPLTNPQEERGER